jgi:predicted nuclease of predicted toxin-antitoxin system
MKFLADMGVSMTVVKTLRSAGYEAIHLSELGLQRLPDASIMLKAFQEQRVVLTFDLDFTDLLAASGDALPSVVIFRLKNTSPAFVSIRLMTVLSECGDSLRTGAIAIVEDGRVRLRRLPLQS